ncbi:MAG: alpha/beta hydrolase [Opitutales bacterium]
MKQSFRCLLSIGCLGLFSSGTLLAENLFDKYSTVPAQERWKVPGPEEEVAGSQNGWYVTPHDLRPGKFGLAAPGKQVEKISEDEIVMIPQSVWGKYTMKITPNGGSGKFADWAKQFNEDKGVRFNGKVTKVGDDRKTFEAMLETERNKEPDLPVTLEVVKVQGEKPLPQVHSRQYGPHWRHTYDIYYPEGFDPKTDDPLPMVLNIHGGGWGALDKQTSGERWNNAGIAMGSINYRYVNEYQQAPEMTVPVAAPLLDSARAVQDIKYHAEELGIDPNKILLTGGSAGGATSAWLAMINDLADPDSNDPVARTSTRVFASAPHQAQTSLDPKQMQEWIPGITYGSHAFMTQDDFPAEVRKGPKDEQKEKMFQYWLENRDKYLEAIKDFSAYEHASADDPPMLLVYGGQEDVIPPKNTGNATHHPKFGEHLNKKLQELGVESLYWADNVSSGDKAYDGWQGTYFWMLHHSKGKE